MKTSAYYRQTAFEALTNNWLGAVVATFVFILIVMLGSGTSAFSQIPTFAFAAWVKGTLGGCSFLLLVLLLLPLEYAYESTFLSFKRRQVDSKQLTENMWYSLKNNYHTFMPACFLVLIIVGISAILTFGIVGIILSYAYKMVPFLINDYPELSAKEALKTSREMMRGHKWDLFCLELSFIGWIILCVLTMGLGLLFVTPYISTATAGFYEDLKSERIEEI